MSDLLCLMAAYGLCFGLMNLKIPGTSWLASRVDVLARMLECTYCTGFHCGWLIGGARVSLKVATEGAALSDLAWLAMFTFASAAFCYSFDAAVRWLERDGG